MSVSLLQVNWLAILAATASAFLLGGLWYGPLFKKAWCREAGMDPDTKPAHPGRVFAVAIICAFLAATIFSMLMPPSANAVDGFGVGFVVGLFFVSMSFGINYAFAQRSLKLWMIDSGYHILQFILYGAILGAWK
jgi:hypothetical protein